MANTLNLRLHGKRVLDHIGELRGRPIVAISCVIVAAALVAWAATSLSSSGNARASGPLSLALSSGSSFRALPVGDLVADLKDPEALRALRVLLAASPELADRVSHWMVASTGALGIDPESVSHRSVVVRFGTDGAAEHAAILDARFVPGRVREALDRLDPVVEHYGGEEIFTCAGLGAVSIVDDRRILVASSFTMARAAVDASAGRDPSAETMGAAAALSELDSVASLAGHIPAGARLQTLLPGYVSSGPFAGAAVVASLEAADGVRLRLDMTHQSPARAQMAVERLRSEFVLDTLAIAGGRLAIDALAPYVLVACDKTRVAVRLDVPRDRLAVGGAGQSAPIASDSLPPELLAPLPEVTVDPGRLQSPEAAAASLPPSPGARAEDPGARAASAPAASASEDRRPFIWSPAEDESLPDAPAGAAVDAIAAVLRTIADAERRYRDAHGAYGTLEELAGAGLLDPLVRDTAVIAGFRIRLVSLVDRGFEVVAEPVDRGAPAFSFTVTEQGVVRYDAHRGPPENREGARALPGGGFWPEAEAVGDRIG